MTERIDHAAKARQSLENVVVVTGSDRQVAIAHIHATLAMVEQQRIANLIAYVGVAQQVPPGSRLTDAEASDLALLQAQAREGLEL